METAKRRFAQRNRHASILTDSPLRRVNLGALVCLVACLSACLPLISGCNKPEPTNSPPVRPLRAMNYAIRKGQWQEAWAYSDQVLAQNSEDAEAIAAVARVAYEIGKPDVSAELMVKSCRAESFRNPARVQQTFLAMIGVGQLMEGLDLLEQALKVHPNQHDLRRLLYDLYMGSELRQQGLPHGRKLVRERAFDLDLLQTLSNTERRTQENEPLQEMIARNPDDMRPLLGEAKMLFDRGEFAESIQLLRRITNQHTDYLPAQALLARALVASGDLDGLESWAAETSSPGIQDEPAYWLALGDWARAKQQHAEAARAYWESTRRDPDVMESWSKLSTELSQVASEDRIWTSETLQAVQQRATLLSTFNQQKQRFVRTGGISRAIVVEIVQTLDSLGRRWEAEAWAALALNLPEDDAVDVANVRASVVAKLNGDTPWQITDGFPELKLNLTLLPLPSIGRFAERNEPSLNDDSSASVTVDHLQVMNEANQRGVRFFGRTADDLDQPGIMLYKTLGCGGATIDFDLDGWPDLYLAAAGGTPPAKDSAGNAMLRNLNGHYVDVTDSSSTGDLGFGQGVAVGDVNEDGFPDVLVLNYGPNTLYINNGDGTFQDASDRLPSNDDSWSAAAAIADIDGDALSDVLIVNYCAGLDPVTVPCPMKDTDVSRSCSPMKFTALADQFLQGQPDGSYADRTAAWSAMPSVPGRGLGVVAGSFDDRPGVDLFVANDMTNNHYWSAAAGAETFQLAESAMLRGLGTDDRSLAQGSMGIAAADLDTDGDIDFYVTNFDGEYNTLHSQLGPGVWQDVTTRVGLARPTVPLVGFGTEAIDLDHDGSMELVVTNGHVEIFSLGDKQSVYQHPMQIFRRNESGTYDSIKLGPSSDYLSRLHVGRALWTLDVNRDGMVDFAVTHQTEPVALLVNHSESRGHWLGLQLIGTNTSRDAIGARVTVTEGDQSFAGFQLSGDGYLCTNERILRFGLGGHDGPCQLTVTWPDGSEESYSDLEPDRLWIVVQGKGTIEGD